MTFFHCSIFHPDIIFTSIPERHIWLIKIISSQLSLLLASPFRSQQDTAERELIPLFDEAVRRETVAGGGPQCSIMSLTTPGRGSADQTRIRTHEYCVFMLEWSQFWGPESLRMRVIIPPARRIQWINECCYEQDELLQKHFTIHAHTHTHRCINSGGFSSYKV